VPVLAAAVSALPPPDRTRTFAGIRSSPSRVKHGGSGVRTSNGTSAAPCSASSTNGPRSSLRALVSRHSPAETLRRSRSESALVKNRRSSRTAAVQFREPRHHGPQRGRHGRRCRRRRCLAGRSRWEQPTHPETPANRRATPWHRRCGFPTQLRAEIFIPQEILARHFQRPSWEMQALRSASHHRHAMALGFPAHVSKTRCMGVCSKSVRLMETWARFRGRQGHPMILRSETPEENRMAWQIFFCDADMAGPQVML